MKNTTRSAVNVPKWLRILIPSILFLVWFVVAGIGGPYFGKISSVTDNDSSAFLPASAESTKVREQLTKFQDSDKVPAILVFSDDGKELSAEKITAIQQATKPLSDLENVNEVSPPVPSEDKQAVLVVVNVVSAADAKELVPKINEKIEQANLDVTMQTTGAIGFLYDLGKAFSGIDGLLLVVALLVVFVILIVVYRSPLLPFVVLFTSLSALTASVLSVYYLANADILTLNGQVQGILFILVIGAATDYSLLFVARYREELHHHERPYQAIIAAWKRALEPIAAAGGTVIAGLLCLLLSDLESNKALGPVGTIGILMAMLAALTLLPSLLMAFGRAVFWPRRPLFEKNAKKTAIPTTGLWVRTAAFVSNHARATWMVIIVLLLAGSAGLIGLRANGVPDSDLILGESKSRDGQKVLDEHFAAGSGNPTYAIIPEGALDKTVSALDKDSGVSEVAVTAKDAPSGSLPVGKSADQLPAFLRDAVKPTVVDGKVLLDITLSDNPDSTTAQDTIKRLRTTLRDIDSSAEVGGATAVQLDTNTAAIHDRNIIIPAILVVITLILMALLRSIASSIILLFATILSFAAALGISSLVFNGLFNFPGADPSVVLYGFVFLVALGIDYNIFLMTRVREESLKQGTRKGVLTGLIVTGGVITSAGIVLAATFAALAVIPVLFLVQLAFVVGFGVLLDTIIIRSLLVPALIHDIGKSVWWPSKKIKD